MGGGGAVHVLSSHAIPRKDLGPWEEESEIESALTLTDMI